MPEGPQPMLIGLSFRGKWLSFIVFPLVVTLSSCDQPSSREVMISPNSGKVIEPTFIEAYAPNLKLPVPVSDFESRLKELGLKYEILKGGDDSGAFPLPSKDSGINPNDLSGCIKIYGAIDRKNRSMQMFRAYENKHSQIVYIENSYAYTGP
jgi:hypothetical protein